MQVEGRSGGGNILHKNWKDINDRAGIEVDYMVTKPKISLLNSILSSSGAYFAFPTEFTAGQNQALLYGNHEFVVNDEFYALQRICPRGRRKTREPQFVGQF